MSNDLEEVLDEQAKKPLSWDMRISLAYNTGHFTEEDKWMASEWNTCAVGENAKVTPGNIIPYTDDVLYALGVAFDMAVQQDKTDLATLILRGVKAYQPRHEE